MQRKELEKRLEVIEDLPNYISRLLNTIPVKVPDNIKEMVLEKLLNNKEISELIEKIKNRRPPRLVLVGRTGCGKSSLINAMFEDYLAETSDVEIGTTESSKYRLEKNGEAIMEIIDTRGIGESEDNNYAELELKRTIKEFNPDAILFLAKAKERAHIDKDVNTLKEIIGIFNSEVPVIALRTQVDELEPSRYKEPDRYPAKKVKNINKAIKELKDILARNNIAPLDIIPVSAYVEWNIDPEEASNYDDLEIEFKGFYNIDRLLKVLTKNIDLEAVASLNDYNEILNRVSNKLIKGFSMTAGVIGATPIPGSDIVILTPLQAILIIIIAYLSGTDINYENAKEFLGSFGLLGGAALGFQQAAKILNVIPGLGSAVSGGIAAAGTWAIGQAAFKYYVENKSIDDLVKFFKKEFNKFKKQYEVRD